MRKTDGAKYSSHFEYDPMQARFLSELNQHIVKEYHLIPKTTIDFAYFTVSKCYDWYFIISILGPNKVYNVC